MDTQQSNTSSSWGAPTPQPKEPPISQSSQIPLPSVERVFDSQLNPHEATPSTRGKKEEQKPRAMQITRDEEALLIETCIDHLDSYSATRNSGNIAFYTQVSESFKNEIGLEHYDWQTASRTVKGLVEWRREGKPLETGTSIDEDCDLEDAIDEFISYLDELEAEEKARRRQRNQEKTQILRHNLCKQYGEKRKISPFKTDSETESSPAPLPVKRQRQQDPDNPHQLLQIIVNLTDKLLNGISDERGMKKRSEAIESRLESLEKNFESINNKLDLVLELVEERALQK